MSDAVLESVLRRDRVVVAAALTLLVAAGTIMAIIMTVHMTKSSSTSTTSQGWSRSIAIPGMSGRSMPGIIADRRKRYSQAASVIASRAAPTIARSRRSTLSSAGMRLSWPS